MVQAFEQDLFGPRKEHVMNSQCLQNAGGGVVGGGEDNFLTTWMNITFSKQCQVVLVYVTVVLTTI